MSLKIIHPDKPMFYRLSKLIVHAQFVWWLGHVTVVFSTLLYLVSIGLNKENAYRFYARVFRGSMLSYGIVVWKGHKPFNPSYKYFLKVAKDETTAYLLLATFWYMASPILVSTIPFFIFSIFHCINYVRTRLFPALSPGAAEELKNYNTSVKSAKSPAAAPSVSEMSVEAQLFLRIQSLTIEHYTPAMKLVSIFEVTILPVVLFIGLIVAQFSSVSNVSILTVFIYCQFLYRRASQSGQTKAAFIETDAFIINQLDQHPMLPPQIKETYLIVKEFVIKLTTKQ